MNSFKNSHLAFFIILVFSFPALSLELTCKPLMSYEAEYEENTFKFISREKDAPIYQENLKTMFLEISSNECVQILEDGKRFPYKEFIKTPTSYLCTFVFLQNYGDHRLILKIDRETGIATRSNLRNMPRNNHTGSEIEYRCKQSKTKF